MGVKGNGRVFARRVLKFRGNLPHSKARSHESFAKAWDLKLPLLRPWQHELCDL